MSSRLAIRSVAALMSMLFAFAMACGDESDTNNNSEPASTDGAGPAADAAGPAATLDAILTNQRAGNIATVFENMTKRAQAEYFVHTTIFLIEKFHEISTTSDELGVEDVIDSAEEAISQYGIDFHRLVDVHEEPEAYEPFYDDVDDPLGFVAAMQELLRDGLHYDGDLFPLASDTEISEREITVDGDQATAVLNGSIFQFERVDDRWYVSSIEGPPGLRVPR